MQPRPALTAESEPDSNSKARFKPLKTVQNASE